MKSLRHTIIFLACITTVMLSSSSVYNKTGGDDLRLRFDNILKVIYDDSKVPIDSLINLANNAELIDSTKLLSEIYLEIAIVSIVRGEYDFSVSYFDKAYNLALEYGYYREMSQARNGMGIIYWKRSEYSKALHYYTMAAKIREQSGLIDGLGKIYVNIGKIYEKWYNYPKALQYFSRGLQNGLKTDNSFARGYALNNIGYIYSKRDMPDSALYYYKKSHKEYGDFYKTTSININYGKIAEVYLSKKEPEKAKPYLDTLYNTSKLNDNKERLSEAACRLGEYYIQMGLPKKAKESINKSITIAAETGLKFYLMNGYKEMALLYEKTGNRRLELFFFKKYALLKDSIFYIDQNERIAKITADFETEKERTLLKAQNELKESEIERRTTIIYLLLILFVMAVFVLIIAVRSNRFKAKVNDDLKVLNTAKDKLFSIISHDLRSPVGVIISFAELIIDDYEKFSDEEKKKFIGLIRDSAKNTNQLLRDLLIWARAHQDYIKIEKTQIVLSEVVDYVISSLKIQADTKQVNLINNIKPGSIVVADEFMLKVVLNNLIANAIKFSYPGKSVNIFSETVSGNTTFHIDDSGIGIKEDLLGSLFSPGPVESVPGTNDEKGTGLGLMICKEFVMKNDGKISAESKPGKGSRFSVSLPSH